MSHNMTFPNLVERLGFVVENRDKNGDFIFSRDEYEECINEVKRLERIHLLNPTISHRAFKAVSNACLHTLNYYRAASQKLINACKNSLRNKN